MKEARLSKAETRILEQYWKLGTASVREILESLPEDERVAYTTVQTLVYRLEEKGALRKVKKIGNAQIFQPVLNQSQHRGRLVRDLLDLYAILKSENIWIKSRRDASILSYAMLSSLAKKL